MRSPRQADRCQQALFLWTKLELAGEVLPGWAVHAGAGFADSEITKDEVFEEGNRLHGVPRVTASLWTAYSFQPDTVLNGLTVGGGVIHVGSREDDLDNSFAVDGFTRLDLSASYAFENGARIAVSLNNVTDKDYIVSVQSDREITSGARRSTTIGIWQAGSAAEPMVPSPRY